MCFTILRILLEERSENLCSLRTTKTTVTLKQINHNLCPLEGGGRLLRLRVIVAFIEIEGVSCMLIVEISLLL